MLDTRHLIVAAATAAALTSPAVAFACGGFFCSAQPVLQTAERIVFEVEGDEVTAYVQLQYVGDDFNFAWIVPVPSTPEIEVGVGQGMFEALDRQTRPQFVTAAAPAAQADFDAGCGTGSFEPRVDARYVPTPDVDVYKQERVGPYEAVVLAAEDARDLNDWLGINGYTLVPGSDPIVQEYLDAGMQLVALKLAPGEGVEAIEPVKLKYSDPRGCAAVPVKLTAIAATPALEIVTWVFGSSRAKPMNYASVDVDVSTVFSENDYRPALARAVNTANEGQGFVTEFAQPTAMLESDGDENLERLLRKHGYVTRLRTELDPVEMTLDPEFTLDPSLPDVSNEIELGSANLAFGPGATFGALALFVFFRRRRR